MINTLVTASVALALLFAVPWRTVGRWLDSRPVPGWVFGLFLGMIILAVLPPPKKRGWFR